MFTSNKQQLAEIARLKGKVTELNENLDTLKADLARFKSQVSKELTSITERINN